MVLSSVVSYINGPRLYRIYKISDRESRDYDPNSFEMYADNIIKVFNFCCYFGIYTSPAIMFFLYKRGYNATEGNSTIVRYIGTLTIVLIGTLFVRGFGRFYNTDYRTFLNTLQSSKQNNTLVDKVSIAKYDFDFNAWPVEFSWDDSPDKHQPKIHTKSPQAEPTNFDTIKNLPWNILSFFVIHSFGKRLLYPGATSLLQYIIAPVLIQGRTKLVEKNKGGRYKLLTREGNEIDTMFVDQRSKDSENNGNILVICCEGNAGFYEYGIMGTPLAGNYSVLGWNHPGFAGSTGVPFPDQEKNAIDIVMQMAIYKLGFPPQNILLYAWSIGGYTATWAAMNYPNIKGLVLDATFDDILPLAIARMTPIIKPLVVATIRNYMDLNNVEHLKKFSGPVLFIRRTRDEMISMNPYEELKTNRGNNLLIRFLSFRYPYIVNEVTEWIIWDWLCGDRGRQKHLLETHHMNEEECQLEFTKEFGNDVLSFPSFIGHNFEVAKKTQFSLFLVVKHMKDFDSTHCTPLPENLFSQPWITPGMPILI